MSQRMSPRGRRSSPQRRLAWTGLITILTLLFSLFPQVIPGAPVPAASAHNLQTKFVYMFFDPNTQAKLDTRIAGGDPLHTPWNPPTSLLKVGDELGIIIKVVPRDGTTTGVGGHVDFYVPDGTTVLDAAYLMPGDAIPGDGISGYDKVAMKGQSLIAVGDGPIGAKSTSQLISLGTVGPNVNGVTENPVVPATGVHRGTIAGVYGDTGIFYSTNPDTAFGSWQRFTGDPDQICGLAGLPGVTGKTLTNNSGDVVVPCNLWDVGQLYAWGVKGTSWTGSGASSAPIVDYGDGRGNAPWGFASGVAGLQSGYAWNFDWNEWRTSTKTAQDMRNAMGNDEVGPWQRIRYSGSRISKDQPGLVSTALGIASIDGSLVGRAVSPSSPLPSTTSQTDTTSPKAIRWAVGQLTSLIPEFVWVKVRVDDPAELVNADGCPIFHGDTFGGDAGGSDSGKDHLWRYYEPSLSVWNGCLALGKPATKDVVKVGEIYQYKVKVYNAGTINDFTNVVIRDTLPSGVQFVSAVPAQSSGPNPLVWNVASLKRGEMFEATVTVKATGTGALENTLCVDAAGTAFDQCATDITTSGSYPMLKQSKTASATAVAPGNSVQYTIQIDNIGGGPTGSPITVREYLPTGFTFASKDLVTINGANVTATTPANTATPGEVLFTVPDALNTGQSLIIRFTLDVPLGTRADTYCNSYTTTQNGVPLTTGSLACLTVGDAAVGDTLFRDWNGNGVQDPEDEGIAGVTVELRNGVCTPGTNCPTTTTDANGHYLFEGLNAGTYTVVITDLGEDRLPASGDELLTGYTQTYDPNGVCPGASCDKQSAVTLTTGQRDPNQDFGFKPGGTGSIGDTVWKDDGNDGGVAGNGVQDGTEAGIANVTVYLYEDTNGNGAIDPDDALVATDETDGSGIYGFTGLALNLNYLVEIDETDPQFLAAFGAGPIAASTFRLQSAQPTADTPAIDTVDFGYYQPPPAAVGDTVCQDVDGDRLCTGTDTPLPNIEVQIYRDLNRNGLVAPGEPLLETDVTDANGIYGFSDLAPGAYVIQVNTADPDLPGGLATVRNPQGVVLASGDNNLDIDFPFVSRLTKAVRNITTSQDPGNDANPGDTLEFQVTPNYTGSSLLTNVRITDTIPAGTTFVSAAPAHTGGPDPLVWNLGSNAADVPGIGVLCPEETTLDAEKDTHIAQNDGDEHKNFGASTVLETANEANRDIAGLLRFSLPTLPSGAALTSATLKLTVSGGQGTNRQIEIHELLTAFTEGTGGAGGNDCTTVGNGASWGDTDGADSNRGGPNCTDSWTPVDSFTSSNYGAFNYGTIDPITDEATYSVDVKALVESWLATPSANKGFAMIPVGTGTNAVSWYSSESTTTAKRPKLVLKYVVPQTGACTIKTDGQAIYSINQNYPQYRPFNGTTNAWGTAASAAAFANKQRYLQIASGTTRNESIAVAVLDNNTVAGQVWNGSSWSFIPNPPAGASGQLGTVSIDTRYSTDVAYESASGDAVLVWDNNSQSAGNKLRFTTFDGMTWAAAASITSPAYAGGEPLTMHLASNPKADGMVLVVNDLTYDDYAVVWDGAAWGNGLSLDTSGTAVDDATPLYATYETASGEAMVVYAKHSATPDAKVYYRIWNGTSWSVEASVSPPAGVTSQPQWLVLASDPSSDHIALGVLTTAKVVWLSVWDGSAWGAKTTATTGAQTAASPVVSVAFESLTGRALAVYGEGKNVRYRIWSLASNTWTGELNGPVLQDNTVTLVLDGDPNSNEIMLTGMDAKKRVEANLWSGSAWGTTTTLSSGSNYAAGQPFDFHWAQNALTQPSTKAAMSTDKTLVTDLGSGAAILVTLTAEASQAGTVTANALTVSGTNGASATCGAASPAGAQPVAANGQVQFTYACTVTAGTSPDRFGSVTFTTTPTAGGGAGAFLEAQSNSVLATPLLTFQVTVDDPATVSEVDNTATIGDESGNLAPTDSNETVTKIPGGSIGDYVWWDNNTNGFQDESPATPISGTIVLLYRDVNNNGILDPLNGDVQVGGPAYTDASGYYLFEDLPPGEYLVDVYEDSIAALSIPYIRNIVPTTADVQFVSLGQAEDYRDADFGYYIGAKVEGNVFWDEDRNGVLDSGEEDSPHLLNDITVHIVCYGPDGAPGGGDDYTGSQDTGTPPLSNGHFAFIVPPGPCTLTYETAQTTAAGYPDATTPISYAFTAEAGEDWHPSFDFGVDHAGAIGDTVWYDVDGDGVGPDGNGAAPGDDEGEPGLAGVTVSLYRDNNNDNALDAGDTFLAALVTDADGRYLFEGLADGTYIVVVNPDTLPDNMAATYDNSGAADDVGQADISGGNSDTTVDFGYEYVPPVGQSQYTISGRVYDDANNNGGDDGETGFANVDVTVVCDFATFVVKTSSDGAWYVPGIPEDSVCTVLDADESDLPRTDYAATETPAAPITVTGDIIGLDFGHYQTPGSISGTVCEATDGDGLCEPGEPGITPVAVTLHWAGPDGILGTGDDTTTTQNTDASGNYSFTGLQPGLYQVVETNLAGYTSIADRDGGNPDNVSVNLALGQNAVDQDFEDLRLASASGYVFEDLDRDGQRDAGEPPLAGVTVALTGPSGPRWATTNDLGYYEFTDLLPGAYTLNETDPAGYTSTGDADGPGNGVNTIAVTLAAGDHATQQNFGDERPGSIAGVVFEDLNYNGVQDSGEGPLENVNVCATPVGGGATRCDLTDATGAYLIPNVPPGDYIVTETDPTGYVSTTPNALPVTVDSGEDVTGVNYGDVAEVADTYSISGTVCENTVDNDGVCDPGETPLPGVTVKLYDDAGALVATTTTDAGGDYTFVNVPDGDYAVVEIDPLFYISVNDADGGTDNTVAVPVAGADVTDQDFVDTPQPGALTGKVFEDLNLNGQYDAGEPGIAGVTITLSTGVTTTTSATGVYTFTNLAPGTYTITETDLTGYISTGDVDGANDNTIVATVSAGQTTTGQDFGDVRPGSISGTVWDDKNSDGIRDPDGADDVPGNADDEVGIPNVLVCAAPVAGAPVCVLTDTNGDYTIPDLLPGAYTVTETDPTGYVSTTPNSVPVTLDSGGDVTGIDFGDVLPDPALGSISGTACENMNGDGVCDANETPLAGVTVELWLVGGGSPLRTTTTDVNGGYLFPNLPAGSYRVEEVNPLNYVSVDDADGPANGTDAIYPIAIAGNAVTGRDFVDTPILGSISGKVCEDLNHDGICGGGEPALSGVTVKLYDSDGNLVDTQTTVGGNYVFNNLPPGTYTVIETDPASYRSTGDVYGANDNLVTAAVPAGGSVTNQNFADAQEPGAITGVVYHDLNGDGDYDPGEPGLPDVQVCLTPPSGPQVCHTTNAGGQYAFLNLPPGDYTVSETNPAGYRSTGDADGATNGSDTITPIAVAAGQTVTEQDFFDREETSAVIGVAKRVVGDPVYNGNGTFDVTYEILVQNVGTVALSNVQVTDDLAATYAAASSFAVIGVSSATFTKNPAYNGSGDTNLLTGADSLAALAEGTITLVVRVIPGGNPGPYNNTAVGSGTPPTGPAVGDDSTDGVDTDPDTPGLTTPADNPEPGDDDVPTPVLFDLPASYTVTKTLVTAGDVRTTGEVVFSIQVQNTGLRPITVLPLQDVYDTNYLIYGFGTLYSIPASADNDDDGAIDWPDLTASFGKDLGLGESFQVIVIFTARADTTDLLPDGKTPNTAIVQGALASPTLPEQSSEARVQILQPTAITLAGFTAAAAGGGVLLRWETLSESRIAGYNLLRQRNGAAGFEPVNAGPIAARHPGQDRGAVYTFRDNKPPDGACTYWLEAIGPDGRTAPLGTIEVVSPIP